MCTGCATRLTRSGAAACAITALRARGAPPLTKLRSSRMCAVDAAEAAVASSSACRSTKRAHSRWARARSAEASRGGGPSERHETCR